MKKKSSNVEDTVAELGLNLGELRQAISAEYEAVANKPDQGFHFHTGRRLTRILGYKEEWLEGIPESSIESFAGTGNPFSIEEINSGEKVVDIGCGAGIDSLVAAKKVFRHSIFPRLEIVFGSGNNNKLSFP